jgi:hypothetical protein
VGWRATNQMRNDLAHHCLNLDMDFHHQHTPGEMIERVDGDTTALSNFFSQFVIQVIGSAFFLIGVLILVAREDWRVGVALTAFSILAFIVFNLTRNIAVPIYTAERESYARLYGFIEERLLGLEDIRTNGANNYAMNRFYNVNNGVFTRVKKSEFMSEGLRTITGIMFALGYALAMGMGIWLYEEGTFTIGAVFLVFHYTNAPPPGSSALKNFTASKLAFVTVKNNYPPHILWASRLKTSTFTTTRAIPSSKTSPSPSTPAKPWACSVALAVAKPPSPASSFVSTTFKAAKSALAIKTSTTFNSMTCANTLVSSRKTYNSSMPVCATTSPSFSPMSLTKESFLYSKNSASAPGMPLSPTV